METNKTYHIDVTQEEDQLFKNDIETAEIIDKKSKGPSKAAFLKIFCVVLGVHVAAAAIIGFGSITANAAGVSDDKKFVGQEEVETQSNAITNNVTTEASPTPAPTPNKPLIAASSKKDWPAPESKPVVTHPVSAIKDNNQQNVKQQAPHVKQNKKLVTHYTVKQGDTIISIAKKYKLNTKRLLKINNITDPTKLKVGQVLKFM